VHVWRSIADGARAHFDGTFEEADILSLMNRTGVDRAVLVTPTWTPDGNDYPLELARRFPDRFAVMGRLAIEKDNERKGILRAWRSAPGMLGVRLTFSRRRHAPWLTDGTSDWLWGDAAETGTPVMVYAPSQASALADIAAKHRGLRLVVDHMAVPLTAHGEEIDPFIDALLPLADLENVAVKVSSLGHLSALAYPFDDVAQRVARVVSAFGAERVFWGSDITNQSCSYEECVSMLAAAATALSPAELELVMGGSLLAWLGWPQLARGLQFGQISIMVCWSSCPARTKAAAYKRFSTWPRGTDPRSSQISPADHGKGMPHERNVAERARRPVVSGQGDSSCPAEPSEGAQRDRRHHAPVADRRTG
jgi:predicted TIM-barrel fold metal-dependent hydrolase